MGQSWKIKQNMQVFFHQSKSQRPSFVGGGGVTWSGKVPVMIKFQRSGTYEKGDMRLTLKTD